MPSPFPGMDPYLERPSLWSSVHLRLIAAIGDALTPLVAPRYYVTVEERTYSDGPTGVELFGVPDVFISSRRSVPDPDGGAAVVALADVDPDAEAIAVEWPASIEVREWYLEIRDVESQKVVTAIELLSPANKGGGEGRRQYLDKRERIRASDTSLVEIDLLRSGSPMPTIGPEVRSDYRIFVGHGHRRPHALLYPFGVRRSIPRVRIPLSPGESEPILNLNAVLHAVYDRARYDLRIDYAEPPVPPLNDADAAWARGLSAGGG